MFYFIATGIGLKKLMKQGEFTSMPWLLFNKKYVYQI